MMKTNRLLKTNKHQNAQVKSIIKMCVFSFVMTTIVACNTESQLNSTEQKLTDQEHQQLLLETKQAILNLDLAMVDKLTAKADINQPLRDHSSLLAWAVETQEPQLVELLLKKGAKVQLANSNRFTPIIQACRYGNSAIINALLDKGADASSTIEDGTSAFQLCAGSATTEDLARMVSLGANINAQNSDGQTPLMWAANFAKAENLNYLVSKGANINQQSQQGYSPLFFAIKSNNLEVVKAAIAQGADLFATTKDGTTATQLGVYTKNYEFLTWYASELNTLMGAVAIQQILTAFDRDGYQLLHAAVKANQAELVSNLLTLGANSTTQSEPAKLKWRYEANFKTERYYPPQFTPIELAEKKEYKNIVSMLSR
ncbi:ankyrin repeat domain-containing protein [Paraglaciecola sp. L3A3]|uniref:ankyrin repeat domain-containing protein n=1 Tax=Paraglaciecola sp. L3A3 TaxID=2686358 RepID=UPI00131D0A57|nr:ankyrin repeat domain-containing protein [Paraglaciecola sp. L3A3]